MMSRRIGVAIGILVAVVLMGIGYGLQRERSTNQHIQVALAEATNALVLAAQMKLGPSTGNTLVTRGTTIMEAAGVLQGATPWLTSAGFGHMAGIAAVLSADAYLLESNDYYPNKVNTRQMLGWVRFVTKELDSCWIRSVNDQDETVVRFDPSKLSLAMKVIYRGMPKEQRANNYATVLDGAPPVAYP